MELPLDVEFYLGYGIYLKIWITFRYRILPRIWNLP